MSEDIVAIDVQGNLGNNNKFILKKIVSSYYLKSALSFLKTGPRIHSKQNLTAIHKLHYY